MNPDYASKLRFLKGNLTAMIKNRVVTAGVIQDVRPAAGGRARTNTYSGSDNRGGRGGRGRGRGRGRGYYGYSPY